MAQAGGSLQEGFDARKSIFLLGRSPRPRALAARKPLNSRLRLIFTFARYSRRTPVYFLAERRHYRAQVARKIYNALSRSALGETTRRSRLCFIGNEKIIIITSVRFRQPRCVSYLR